MSLTMSTFCVEGCSGHLGKFDNCVAEAAYELSLDQSTNDGWTGDSDFDGHFTLLIIEQDHPVTIDPDGESREVTIPAGNYIVHTNGRGAVTLQEYDTEAAARAEFDAAHLRFELWAHGCDPDNPDAHDDCADTDECVLSWQ